MLHQALLSQRKTRKGATEIDGDGSFQGIQDNYCPPSASPVSFGGSGNMSTVAAGNFTAPQRSKRGRDGSIDKDGLTDAGFEGRPRARSVDCKPNGPAGRSCHDSSPNAAPLATDCRSAAYFPSLWTDCTCRQSRGKDTGILSRSLDPHAGKASNLVGQAVIFFGPLPIKG
jgi:hypothetical protein